MCVCVRALVPKFAMTPPKATADDLDDLDGTWLYEWLTQLIDVLDDFEAPMANHAPELAKERTQTNSSNGSGAAANVKGSEKRVDGDANAGMGEGEDPLSDEFVEELTKNMESFMAQLGKDMSTHKDAKAPPLSSGRASESESGGAPPPAEDELMKQFEKLLLSSNLEGLDRDAMPSLSKSQTQAASKHGSETHEERATGSSDASGEKSFQDAVKATMDKLKQSNASANNSSSNSDTSNPLAALGLDGNADFSKILEALSQPGEDGEGSLSKMLAQMMEDLMNKDVLYEPLKDMHSRFPAYLASPAAEKLDDDTRQAYVAQEATMGEIIAVFESSNYSDSNPEKRKQVADLVSKLQEFGTPPQELLGDMPPELAGLNQMLGESSDENCVIM